MQAGINFEDIKQYNAALRQYKEQSAKLNAEIEFNERELQAQCAELSKELGMEVTPDNIEGILQDRIVKINNTMQIGNEILRKIREEESQASGNGNAGANVQSGMGAQTNAQAMPLNNMGLNSGAQASNPFNSFIVNQRDASGLPTNLPPLFGNRQ